MDCHSARWLLMLRGREPNQLDSAESEALDRHVERCSDCLAWNHGESRFDTSVAAAMRQVTAPASLKGNILKRLSPTPAPRRWGWVAAAAVLGLSLGLGAYLVWPHPAEVDLQGFLQEIDYKTGAKAEKVEADFEAMGFVITAPPQFRYDTLASYDLGTFQGRQVPRLTFRNDAKSIEANVYVLPESQFQLAHDPLQPIQAGVHRKLYVLRAPGFVYVVDCVGGELGPPLLDNFY